MREARARGYRMAILHSSAIGAGMYRGARFPGVCRSASTSGRRRIHAMTLQEVRQHRHLRLRSAAARPHRAGACACSMPAAAAAQSRLSAASGLRRLRQRCRCRTPIAQVPAWRRRSLPAARSTSASSRSRQTSFPDAHADVVIASAVLHFARDAAHFQAMFRQMWRVLGRAACSSPGSRARSASSRTSSPLGDGRFRLPDGSDRFLVDAPTIAAWTASWAAASLDPIKTTVVQDQRSMTTWVAKK